MTMQPFVEVTGPAARLDLDNLDTDTIIRIEHLTGVPRDQLGEFALHTLRFRADGSEDPAFVLNQPAYRSAPILLGGRNFGCGSSREHAVISLYARGIRCVVAPSFGDIFHNNCFQVGMLPIVLPHETIASIAHAATDATPVTVDLQRCEIRLSDGSAVPFTIRPMQRAALLAGQDEIGLTRAMNDEILAWQARDRAARPWVWNS